MNPAARANVILSPGNMPSVKVERAAEPTGFQKGTAFSNPQAIIQIPQISSNMGQVRVPEFSPA